MKTQVLFIHSAGPQGIHTGSGDLVAYLQNTLGTKYQVISPKMPDPENPSYDSWKQQIEKELTRIESGVILVGHSLGGSVLIKYLSEEKPQKPVAGLCLVATPFWGKKGWKSTEFTLSKNRSKLAHLPKTFLFHSSDDEVVPSDHLTYYAETFPFATVSRLTNVGHLFAAGSPELVAAIKQLSKTAKFQPRHSIGK